MELDITKTTTTSMDTEVSNYSVSPKVTDASSGYGETTWDSPYWSKWYGYYKTIPELKSAINCLATWILGQGYTCDSSRNKVILEHINGWGEDTFSSVLWNLFVTKKINGDAFAEIIRDKGIIQNLKPLDPSSMRIVCNPQGKIIRYEQRSKIPGDKKTFKVEDIFHISNDRVADNIHGESIIEAVQWVIDAKNEAMADWRRISHRSTIRVLFVDEDDKTRLANLKSDYASSIKYGELIILPTKAGDAQFQDLTLPPVEAFLAWIRYLENFYYQALGIPRVVLGGTAENTEASAKVSVIVWEPTFVREITELEQDVWNQLGIKLKINKQPSLMDNMYNDEQKNTGQVGFQPNDVTAGVGK